MPVTNLATMLRSFLVVMLLINSVTLYPLQEEEELRDEQLRTPHGRLRQYVEKISICFQELLTISYKHLTPRDFAKALEIFEEFEERFSTDLDEVLLRSQMGKKYKKKPRIQDGVPDSTFQIVKQRIKSEFPNIGEHAIDELVYRFRRNVMWTKFKLYIVIAESKTLQYRSSEEEEEEYSTIVTVQPRSNNLPRNNTEITEAT